MSSVNKSFLIGRVVKDVETKTVGDNISVARFTVAVDRRFKSKNSDEKATDYISVEAWRKLAETAGKYLHKGRLISVIGSIKTYTWKKDENTTITGFCIEAEDIQFLDSAKNENTGSDNTVSETNSLGEAFAGNGGFVPMDTFEDDLPFGSIS